MPDMMRVEAISTGFSGAPGFSVFYFSSALAPIDNTSATLACNRVRDAFTAARNLFPGAWSVTISPDVPTINPANGTLTGSLSGATSTVTGNAGAGSVYGPAPVGLQVRYSTPDVVNGKHVSGRTFLVPVASVTNEGNGTPTAAAVTLAAAFGTSMLDAGTTDIDFGVWSRPVDAAHAKPSSPARAGSFHGATGSSVKDQYVVLRSRRD